MYCPLQCGRWRRAGALDAGGNEEWTGIGAGANAEAQALLGQRVGMFGGEMYAGYRCLPAQQCMAFDDSVSAEQTASCFVNR